MGLPLFVDPARVTTKDLLGDEYPDERAELLPHPACSLLPTTITLYTEDRLKRGLLYADHTLRYTQQTIAPATTHCLSIYKRTVESLLKKDYADEKEKMELLYAVRFYERGIITNTFLYKPFPDMCYLSNTFMEHLSDLRRYEFAVRYGDYVVPVFRRMDKPVPPQSSPGHFDQRKEWGDFWANICLDLENEQADWNRWELHEFPVRHDTIGTTLAISKVCDHLGLNRARTLVSVRMYGDRNGHIHKSVAVLAERHLWGYLAKAMAEDLRDLAMVIPDHSRLEILVLQGVINAVIDMYFVRSAANPHHHHLWTPRYQSLECAMEPREVRRLIIEGAMHRCGAITRQCSNRLEEKEGRSQERRLQQMNWRALIAAHRNAYFCLERFHREIANAVESTERIDNDDSEFR